MKNKGRAITEAPVNREETWRVSTETKTIGRTGGNAPKSNNKLRKVMIGMDYLSFVVWFKRRVERHHPFQHFLRLKHKIQVRAFSEQTQPSLSIQYITHFKEQLQTRLKSSMLLPSLDKRFKFVASEQQQWTVIQADETRWPAGMHKTWYNT